MIGLVIVNEKPRHDVRGVSENRVDTIIGDHH